MITFLFNESSTRPLTALLEPLLCEGYKVIKSRVFPRQSEEVAGSDSKQPCFMFHPTVTERVTHQLNDAVVSACFWGLYLKLCFSPLYFFSAGIWLLLPLFTSFVVRTEPGIRPSNIPTPVMVGLSYSLCSSLCVSVLVTTVRCWEKNFTSFLRIRSVFTRDAPIRYWYLYQSRYWNKFYIVYLWRCGWSIRVDIFIVVLSFIIYFICRIPNCTLRNIWKKVCCSSFVRVWLK